MGALLTACGLFTAFLQFSAKCRDWDIDSEGAFSLFPHSVNSIESLANSAAKVSFPVSVTMAM